LTFQPLLFQGDQVREIRLLTYHNMVRGMRVLVDATRKLGIPLENPEKNGLYGQQLLLIDNVAQVKQSYKMHAVKVATFTQCKSTTKSRLQFCLGFDVRY
jgi:hypothetical protein